MSEVLEPEKGDSTMFPLDGNAEMEMMDEDVGVENGDFDHVIVDSNLADNSEHVASPHREFPGPQDFASLKAKTFDYNFKDLEELKRKNELLALSKRFLYSKLYTPKLQVLQQLVEPGVTEKWDYRTLGSSPTLGSLDALRPFDTHFSSIDSQPTSARIGDESSPALTTWSSNELDKRESPLLDVCTLDSSSQDRIGGAKVITLVTSSQYVNGQKKKRVEIPITAYKPSKDAKTGQYTKSRVIVKVVEADSSSWLQLLERKLDDLVQSSQLLNNTILDEDVVLQELESVRPKWMDKETFSLICCKPIGMPLAEFIQIVNEANQNESNPEVNGHEVEEIASIEDDVMLASVDGNRLERRIVKKLDRFNLINTNAMGYVLDAEADIIKEFSKLNRVHRRLMNEEDIYQRIFENMQFNFTSQAEDLLQTTRQDLRLAAGYSYLQWGRIKNITSYKPGDQVSREKGFCQEIASKTKIKTLERMREILEGTNACNGEDQPTSVANNAASNEAQYMYYIKSLQDMEECEQSVLTLQITRDRLQALAEYSAIGPPLKPENCYAWKCIGVSSNCIVWKMFDVNLCIPIVYKYRQTLSLTNCKDELKAIYQVAMDEIVKISATLDTSQLLFSNGFEILDEYIVEPMSFIRYLPLSQFIENLVDVSAAEKYSQVQVLVRKICKMVHGLNTDFILPLKSSRIYVHAAGVLIFAGIPGSLLGTRGLEILQLVARPTIATLLWGKGIEWYLPPECNGNPAYIRNPELVSRAHVWMIGKIVYEATCHSSTSKVPLDMMRIENCEDESTREFLKVCLEPDLSKRPNLSQLMTLPYLKRLKLNYGTFGPVDVPKVQCAVEFLGDIETIVLNKIKKTEKGVADYECEKYETPFCDTSDEELSSLDQRKRYTFKDSLPHMNPIS